MWKRRLRLEKPFVEANKLFPFDFVFSMNSCKGWHKLRKWVFSLSIRQIENIKNGWMKNSGIFHVLRVFPFFSLYFSVRCWELKSDARVNKNSAKNCDIESPLNWRALDCVGSKKLEYIGLKMSANFFRLNFEDRINITSWKNVLMGQRYLKSFHFAILRR